MNNYKYEDQIDIKKISLFLWQRKNTILIFTITTIVISSFYVFSLPNIYTSKTILKPSQESSSLNGQLGVLSSMSSLTSQAGLSLNQGQGKTQEAIQRIRSYDFFVNQVMPDMHIENLIAVDYWDQDTNTIFYDENIYDASKDKWSFYDNSPSKPSKEVLYNSYRKILRISEDKLSSFVTITIDHASPVIAQQWTNLIVKKINEHMRNIDKDKAQKSIIYLGEAAQNAYISDVKQGISLLLQDEIKKMVLMESSEFYIFDFIDSPRIPEKKSKPYRFILILISSFSAFLSICIYLIVKKAIKP
jgi:uncharacterized protein involved in exopolysaccharide biosynthesis